MTLGCSAPRAGDLNPKCGATKVFQLGFLGNESAVSFSQGRTRCLRWKYAPEAQRVKDTAPWMLLDVIVIGD